MNSACIFRQLAKGFHTRDMGKLLLTTFVVLVVSAGTFAQYSSSKSSSSSSEEEPDPRTDDCSIDIVLVLDDSSSIKTSLFYDTRDYMNAFASCFDSTDDVTVGVVLYNCEARTEVVLGKYTASDHYLMYEIASLKQQGGVTRTGPAIRYMKDTANFRGGTQRVAIVLTDGYIQGEPLDDHVAEANAARAAGITLYSVGLGDNLDSGVLEDIAGSHGNVFDDIDPCDLADQILQDQCEKDSRGSSSGSSSAGGGSSGGSGSVGSGGSSGSGGSNGGGASESKSKASESKSKASESKSKASESKSKASESQSGGASESKSKASESKSKASEG
ncbi:COL12A1 [Branchiostoma lanceolatum]|uniref:COL12A1 protein n=1 Tax=Branchiostoma lanceolatum TaxID=7740 RepID=A0A8K0ABB7_BRALA|nr:COL12A1 [Branchiostoma lanceolatum]